MFTEPTQRNRGAFVALLFTLSCSGTSKPANEPPITARAALALERFYAVQVPDGAADRSIGKTLFGGFDGAAPKGEVLIVKDASGRELARATADDQGRFKVGVEADAGAVLRVSRLQGDPTPIEIRVRDPAQARRDAIGTPIAPAGSIPNDLIFCGTPSAPRLILVRSGDNAVSDFDLVKGLDNGRPGVRLPDVGGKNANPWFAAALDSDCKRVGVTAWLQKRTYLLDMDRGEIASTLAMTSQVSLDPPLMLPIAADVEENGGAMIQEVRRFTPTKPQAIAVQDGKIWVGFAGFLAPRLGPDKPPVFVPGVLASWRLDALDAAPELFVLPAMNPNEIRPYGDHQLSIVCTGVLDFVGGMSVAATPGAVVFFDVRTKQVADRIDLGDFAPSTAVVSAGAVWVGSSVKAALRRVGLQDHTVTRDYVLSDAPFDSIFRIVDLDGGLIGVPSFDGDRLYLVDTRTGVVSPPPFFAPLQIGPGGPVSDGLQIIARRPGRPGVDFSGPDLYALAGIASKVTPIELRKLLGP